MSFAQRPKLKFAAFAALILAGAAALVATPGYIANPILRAYPPVAVHVDAMVLAANVAESYTVPSTCNFAIFASTTAFYLRTGGTAAIPATEVADGTAPALNPAARRVTAGGSLSFIAPAASIVTIECYADGGIGPDS